MVKHKTLEFIVVLLSAIVLSVILVELTTFIVCWAFGLEFSLKLGVGVWVIMFIVGLVFSGSTYYLRK